MEITQDTFFRVWLAGIVLIWPAWLWYSFQSRKSHGEPIIPRRPTDADFYEGWASGSVQGNIFGRASNCLLVCVAGRELWIAPRFPFNLIAPYGFMALDYRVPTREVQAVMGRGFSGKFVSVELPGPRRPRIVNLTLRAPEAF